MQKFGALSMIDWVSGAVQGSLGTKEPDQFAYLLCHTGKKRRQSGFATPAPNPPFDSWRLADVAGWIRPYQNYVLRMWRSSEPIQMAFQLSVHSH
jgi:hypothetical protein